MLSHDAKRLSLAPDEGLYPVATDAVLTEGRHERPPIVYSSPGAFLQSFGQRWKSLWTRRFILSLLCGQVVSLCITCTNVTTTELVNRNWTLSTTQTFFLFVHSMTCYYLPQS